MKKGILVLVIMLVLSGSVIAAGPYIQSNPQTDAEVYRVRLSTDGVTWGEWVQALPVAGSMKFDISSVAPGTYQGQAQAGANTTVVDKVTNITSFVFKWSTDAPFVLKVPSIGPPTSIKVVTGD